MVGIRFLCFLLGFALFAVSFRECIPLDVLEFLSVFSTREPYRIHQAQGIKQTIGCLSASPSKVIQYLFSNWNETPSCEHHDLIGYLRIRKRFCFFLGGVFTNHVSALYFSDLSDHRSAKPLQVSRLIRLTTQGWLGGLGILYKLNFKAVVFQVPSLKISWYLKINDWKMKFPFGMPYFSGSM